MKKDVIYAREANCDLITKWKINELANDFCDEGNRIIFAGEPIQA